MTTGTPTIPGWDLPESPFHAGELAIQERVGVRAKIDLQGRRAIRRFMTAQHQTFFGQIPFVFLASVDASGQPWASILVGAPGFMTAASPVQLRINAAPVPGDPLAATLRDGAELAALGIELPTRRRNRVIGTAFDVSPSGFSIAVRQTMGVCPQYIQARDSTPAPGRTTPRIHTAASLDEAATALISRADTYFVASNNPRAADGIAAGADISHRGGRPGFVRVDDAATLTAPDFVGNFIFNTLGNFAVDPRAGLLFADFDSGDLLFLAATAEVIWDGDELRAFAGAQRLVRYHISNVIRLPAALPRRFTPPAYSPMLARTGTWEEAASTLAAARLRNMWRPFTITAKTAESSTITSLALQPADALGLAAYEPGQYLPIRVTRPGQATPDIRSYTLSDAPGGGFYRISVKRAGSGGVADFLHDLAAPGTTLEALAPRGDFTFHLDTGRPAVLVSAGVGITPMIAMLNAVLVNDGRTRFHQRLVFVHGARNSAEHAFAGYLRTKAARHANLTVHTRYSAPGPGDLAGAQFDSTGHVDAALLQSLLPLDDYDFYLCGPPGFMQSLYDGLLALGGRDARIHLESFGPASLTRARPDTDSDHTEGVTVRFAQSGTTAIWRPRSGTLLDLAERAGVAPPASCRAGICGTCATRVLAGAVTYATQPTHGIATGEALLCCAHPVPGPHIDGSAQREGITLDL